MVLGLFRHDGNRLCCLEQAGQGTGFKGHLNTERVGGDRRGHSHGGRAEGASGKTRMGRGHLSVVLAKLDQGRGATARLPRLHGTARAAVDRQPGGRA